MEYIKRSIKTTYLILNHIINKKLRAQILKKLVTIMIKSMVINYNNKKKGTTLLSTIFLMSLKNSNKLKKLYNFSLWSKRKRNLILYS